MRAYWHIIKKYFKLLGLKPLYRHILDRVSIRGVERSQGIFYVISGCGHFNSSGVTSIHIYIHSTITIQLQVAERIVLSTFILNLIIIIIVKNERNKITQIKRFYNWPKKDINMQNSHSNFHHAKGKCLQNNKKKPNRKHALTSRPYISRALIHWRINVYATGGVATKIISYIQIFSKPFVARSIELGRLNKLRQLIGRKSAILKMLRYWQLGPKYCV